MNDKNVETELLEKLSARADVASVTKEEDGLLSVLMKGETEPRIVSTEQIEQLNRNVALSDSVLEDFVAAVTVPREALEATPQLGSARPVVRSKSTLDGFEQLLATEDKPAKLIRYPLVADIEAAFVFQTPNGMRYATENDLNTLNISKSDFAEAAMRNFDAMTLKTEWSRSDNVLIAQLDGNYESSLLLIDNLWPEIENALGGPIVVGVPARDSLVAVRADDTGQVAELRRAMDNGYAYPISSTLLTRRNGRWVEFE
jgi:uncharacterized protein YtpQ (UPF0354 family)